MIAEVIAEDYYSYDGFVIIMGTDTMAYAASSLSFMLENLAKPVIFTGSMIPLFKGESDARRNLLLSIKLAATSNIPEVCIFFHDKLLRGNRAKKISVNSLNAFDSPNLAPLATCGTLLTINDALVLHHSRKQFSLRKEMDSSVLVIRLIPGFCDRVFKRLFEPVVDENGESSLVMKALVLELYGAGNAPIKKRYLLDLLENAINCGLVVAICSQCIHGEVNLLAYELGKNLNDIGALSTFDMTVEAVATKLAFLFGQGCSSEEVRDLMTKSLRGEVTESHYLS